MIRNGRTITLGDEFIRELELTEKYLGRQVASRGRRFTSQVMDFVLDTIARLPFAFPLCDYPTAPGISLRRAVFRKQHVIIYEVSDAEVAFVFFHHTSRSSPDLGFL